MKKTAFVAGLLVGPTCVYSAALWALLGPGAWIAANVVAAVVAVWATYWWCRRGWWNG